MNVVVVSHWIFTTESVLECPALERLSRAPPDRPRPRDRATPAPHSSPRGRRRKNGRQRQTRRALSVDKEPSPIPDYYVRTQIVEVFVHLGTAYFTPQQAGDMAHRDIERGKRGPDRIGGDYGWVRVGVPNRLRDGPRWSRHV